MTEVSKLRQESTNPNNPPPGGKDDLFIYLRYYWRDLVLLATFIASLGIMQLLNHPIGTVHSLKIPFDDKIPLLPWTALIYNTWAPLIIILSLLYFFRDRSLFRRYIITMILGQLLADLTFVFFQTTIPIPYEQVYSSTDIFSRVLAITYRLDNNFCGFPSIHVILCTLTIFFIWKLTAAKTWLKISVTVYFFIVALSTVTTKQHVVLDIPGGILYGLIAIPAAVPLARLIERKCYKEQYK
ncbi:MAG: hypothetical protein GX834_07045 [Clostridiaceae bacterium]|nr:hypothetical protein [Clostridiaceae bacterium]HZW97752.1 phosphatase PAP2 family protein [Bacillota bacterium]